MSFVAIKDVQLNDWYIELYTPPQNGHSLKEPLVALISILKTAHHNYQKELSGSAH